MDSILSTTLNYLLVSILILSVIDKIKNWNKNSTKMEAYRILDKKLIKPFNLLFLVTEIYLSVNFIFMKADIWDIAIFIMLMGIYTLAISINLYRGNVRISCGCGGVLESNQLTSFLVYRNLVLIIIAFVIFNEGQIEFSMFKDLNSLLLALTILFLYGASVEFYQQRYFTEKIKSKLLFFN